MTHLYALNYSGSELNPKLWFKKSQHLCSAFKSVTVSHRLGCLFSTPPHENEVQVLLLESNLCSILSLPLLIILFNIKLTVLFVSIAKQAGLREACDYTVTPMALLP